MCDPVTKFNFRWSHVAEGVSILLMLGLIYGFLDMRDYIKWSETFHKGIPDTFFKGERWSFAEEMKSQTETNQQINTLDKRMSLIEAQHVHAMQSLRRIEDAVVIK